MLRVDILTKQEQKEYEIFLDELDCSSCQFSLEWRNVINKLGKDEPYFLVAKENGIIVGVLPLYYYRHKLGNLLTTIAWHTISGTLSCRKTNWKEIYKALLDRALMLAEELDCTAISINTNPFQDSQRYCQKVFAPDYVMENFIQFMNLNEIFNQKGNFVHPNYTRRTNLSRNLEKSMAWQTEISEQQTKRNIDKCFRIYEKRMEEVGAIPLPLSKEFFDSVWKGLVSKGKGKFLFAHYEGKMVSSGLFLIGKSLVDAYMMCMDSDYRRLGTNYVLIRHILKWAWKNKYSTFNWMSSDKRGSGLYKWKEQWGSHEATCLYLTKILGDITHWKNMGHSELQKAYKSHYLLPFNLLKKKHSRFTTKDEITSST